MTVAGLVILALLVATIEKLNDILKASLVHISDLIKFQSPLNLLFTKRASKIFRTNPMKREKEGARRGNVTT